MLRAAPRALSCVAAVAVVFCSPVAATPGLFDVNFDTNPAPGAKGALRDKSYLPAQICGIIGAYIVCVLVVGTALLTYGRRMRRQVTDQRVDVVKANGANGFEMTPVSPASRSRWHSPLSPSKLKHAFKRSSTSVNQQHSVPTSPISPGAQSMSSFDQNFLKNQQEERQREMERLYAAVMEHDEEKNKKALRASAEEIQEIPEESEPPVEKGDRRPPMIDTGAASLRVPSGQNPASPASPGTPRSPVRAIYPPESPMGASRRAANYAGPPPNTSAPASPRGILSKKDRTASIGSTGSKSRRSIRNLRISGPIARYPGGDDEEARTPLSPRFYNPGPPPSPPSATTAPTPTTPGTSDTLGPFHYEDLNPRQPLPRSDPQRSGSARSSTATQQRAYYSHSPRPSNGSNNININMNAVGPAGPPPKISTDSLPPPPKGIHRSAASPASSTSTLPLRNMVPESAQLPTTKTTVVEARNRTRDLMSPSTQYRGGMRTPGTAGVPMTPYSPYMPFTPVTPVTPHLVTRKERKKREKEERKYGLKSPLEEGDEVGDVDWGDAY